MKLNRFDFTVSDVWTWVKANWKPNKTQLKYFILLQITLLLSRLIIRHLEEDGTESSWIVKNIPDSRIFLLAYALLKEVLPYALIIYFTWLYFRTSKGTLPEAFQWGLLNALLQIALTILALPASLFMFMILKQDYSLYILTATPMLLYGTLTSMLLYSSLFLMFRLRWYDKIFRPYVLMVASFSVMRLFSIALLSTSGKTATDLVYGGLHLNLSALNISFLLISPLRYVFLLPAYLTLAGKIRLTEERKIIYFLGVVGVSGFIAEATSRILLSILDPVFSQNAVLPLTVWLTLAFAFERAAGVILGAWLTGKYAKESIT